MINQNERLIISIIPQLYFDSKDQTQLRMNITNIVKILQDSGIILPQTIFEHTLQKELDQLLVGKAPANKTILRAVAELIVAIAMDVGMTAEEFKKTRIALDRP